MPPVPEIQRSLHLSRRKCMMDLRTMIYRYCNYQERCQKEVREKLYENGAHRGEVDQLMADLISDGLVNEERYARSFARGRFRIKNWGRKKIVYELKQDQISEYCIRKALTEIDEDEYRNTLEKLAAKKLLELRSERNSYTKKMKLQRYLQQKGYETELVQEIALSLI
jgi:regulatory protein